MPLRWSISSCCRTPDPSRQSDTPLRTCLLYTSFSIADGQSRAEVEAIYRRDAADPGRRQYTILLKPEGRPIGRIVLADRIEGWKVEIFRIYIADTALRGKGYGKQAMQAILKLSLIHIYFMCRLCVCPVDGGGARHPVRQFSGGEAPPRYPSAGGHLRHG